MKKTTKQKYIYTVSNGGGGGGLGLSATAKKSSNRSYLFLGGGEIKECVRMLHISSLSGRGLSPLGDRDAVKAAGSVGTPGQPRDPQWQAVGVLDLPTHHRAAHRAALLRRHLLAPLNPRTPRRGEATVRGVVCPAAPGLWAEAALAGQGRLVGVGRFALRTGAGAGARPGTVARGYPGAEVIVLDVEARRGGAELVAGLGLPGQPRGRRVALRVRGAAGRVVPVVLELSHPAVERAAFAHSSFLTRPLLGYLLLGRLGADQDHFQPQRAGTSILRPHGFVGFDGGLHLLELHDGTFLGAELSVAPAQPLQVGRQILPGLQHSDRGDGAIRAELLEQQLHQLLLLSRSSLATTSMIISESCQLRPALQVTEQQHAAGQRLAGEDGHCGFAPHLAPLLVQLENTGVSQSIRGRSPVSGQVFHLQKKRKKDNTCYMGEMPSGPRGPSDNH